MMSRLCAWVMTGFLAAMSLAPSAFAQTVPGGEGVLVYSVSTLDIAMNFTFRYRRDALPSGERAADQQGVIECRCVGFWSARMPDPDFTGRETGKVVIRRLPAGDYSIFDFGFGGSIAGMSTRYSSGEPFSIPFRIRPGEVTYIGNFARAPSLGTPLERQLGAAGFFVISDKSERDLAIARRKDASIMDVSEQVTDVSAFGHPALRTVEP